MDRRDWTLLALAAAEGEPVTPVQLQKVLFLVGENFASEVGQGFYNFRPYNYGPFDSAVYTDAENLARDGLALIESQPGRSWVEYRATGMGVIRASELLQAVSPPLASYLSAVVHWARSLTFQQLVSSIYKMYPDQRANSVFVGP